VDVVLRNQNEVNNGHPYLLSPFDGQITEFQPKFGRIVIKGTDPVTGEVRQIELLHSQTQLFDPEHLPVDVKRGQRIGTMGGVGAGGRVHLHVQSLQPGDASRTPLNPLKSLFEYLHPGEPVPALEPFAPPQVSRNPALKPPSNIGPPLDLRPHGLPPTPRGGSGSSPLDPLGPLHFNPQPSPRQFGPFTLPGPNSSGTDISAPRNGNPMGSSIPIVATPSQIGSASGAVLQPINGNAANPTDNDIGGAWTTAQQYMSGQPPRLQPAAAPSYDMPGAFPERGAAPIGYLNGANQTGTFDPATPDVPLPRPRPPQASASWPNSSVAPLQQMPQAELAAPWQPDGRDAGDAPRQNLPDWAPMQPPAENTFPTSNGIGGGAGDQAPAPENAAPPPPLTVQNLTTHVLRMKGVPDADIGAAINDPAKMQNLLNQLYGRRPTIAPGDGNDGFGNPFGKAASAGQPGQASTPAAATPDDYIPFGWSGLPPLLR
jgi:hypothetical protein